MAKISDVRGKKKEYRTKEGIARIVQLLKIGEARKSSAMKGFYVVLRQEPVWKRSKRREGEGL
jgi:hypothetical protein